jgi:hypothetical protein
MSSPSCDDVFYVGSLTLFPLSFGFAALWN